MGKEWPAFHSFCNTFPDLFWPTVFCFQISSAQLYSLYLFSSTATSPFEEKQGNTSSSSETAKWKGQQLLLTQASHVKATLTSLQKELFIPVDAPSVNSYLDCRTGQHPCVCELSSVPLPSNAMLLDTG